ncbi:MAG: hypothetical protein ABW321_07820 [Polyangiales bacterium]
MFGSPLTRLRLAFVVLAAALLVPLALLLRSVESRLEAQRRLRHEIVAERVFDEMERELTQLLLREGERPSAAYDATETRVASWAPFVVGYFTRDDDQLRVIAAEQLTAARVARVARAVMPEVVEPARESPADAKGGVREGSGAAKAASAHGPESASDRVLAPAPAPATSRGAAPAPRREAPAPAPAAVGVEAPREQASRLQSEDILRQLNRSAEQRGESERKRKEVEADEAAPAPKKKAARATGSHAPSIGDDPLSGFP